jgi:hypothetical protein
MANARKCHPTDLFDYHFPAIDGLKDALAKRRQFGCVAQLD